MLEIRKPGLLDRIFSNENYAKLSYIFCGGHTYRMIQGVQEQDVEQAIYHGVNAALIALIGNYFIKEIKEHK